MAKRRRRRPGTWFPNVGTSGPAGDPDNDDYGRWFTLTAPANPVDSQELIIDLTFDQPEEDEAAAGGLARQSLSDIIGSEYILKRIVGNFFAALDQATTEVEGAGFGVVLTAGFFVARAEDSSTEAADVSLPIGTETALETRENYSPAQASTIREPWIWRRRWILGNNFRNFITPNGQGVTQFPATTSGFHSSAMSGPFIDARTIRRVNQDDRLWFVATARSVGPVWSSPFSNPTAVANQVVNCHLDYRLYGSLTRAKARGAF